MAGQQILAPYARANVWHRHRRLILILFGLFSVLYGAAFAMAGGRAPLPFAMPLAVLGMVSVWLLPEQPHPPVAALRALFIAYIIAMLCWPDYLAFALPGMPWITAQRLTALPLIAVLLVCLSTSSKFRRELMDSLRSSSAVWRLLVVFVGLSLFSIVVSTNPGASIGKFVIAQLYWTSIFFVAVYYFGDGRKVEPFAFLLWGIVLFVAAIGIWEARIKALPWAGHIPSFLAIEDPSVAAILDPTRTTRAAAGVYRIQSRFNTPLGLGEYYGLTAPFLIHLIMFNRRLVVKAAAVLTIGLMVYVIRLADTRVGIIGVGVAFLAYPFLWGVARMRERKADDWIAPLIVYAYPAIFVASLVVIRFVPKFHIMVFGGGAAQFSTLARLQQWTTGWGKIFARPWGYGMGQGAATLGYVTQKGQLTIDSYFLAVMLEYGVVGFIVYYGMIVAAIVYGGLALLKSRRPETLWLIPLIIALSYFMVAKTVFSQQENHPLVFAMMGAVVALVAQVHRDQRKALPRPGQHAA